MALVLKNIFTPGVDQINQNYIIESWHVSQSVDAFTGTQAYDITLSGSFTLTGSQYVTGSISSSGGANTVGFYGTSSWAVSSSKAISSSFATTASYIVSSSYATTSSFASTASYIQTVQTASYVLGTAYPSGSSFISNSVFKFIAGAGKTTSGILGVNITELTGKTLGQNCFVSLALSSSAGLGPVVQVRSLSTGVLTFTSVGGDPDFFYTILYI